MKKQNTKKTKVSPFWSDYKLFWDDEPDTRGPDPRIRDTCFYIYSSDEKNSSINDAFAKNDFTETTKTMKEALKIYHSRVQRSETQWCDLMLCVFFGGLWSKADFAHPRYGESWTYIARWRFDTVCIKSYSLNPMQFAERSGIKANELEENNKKHNGLISFWKK
jgi:hypothetical protein